MNGAEPIGLDDWDEQEEKMREKEEVVRKKLASFSLPTTGDRKQLSRTLLDSLKMRQIMLKEGKKKKFEVGDVVAAMHSEDGEFYKGTIVENSQAQYLIKYDGFDDGSNEYFSYMQAEDYNQVKDWNDHLTEQTIKDDQELAMSLKPRKKGSIYVDKAHKQVTADVDERIQSIRYMIQKGESTVHARRADDAALKNLWEEVPTGDDYDAMSPTRADDAPARTVQGRPAAGGPQWH